MSKETIVLGGGCFWCLEAVYKRVEGVTAVRSGYAGGSDPDPDYNKVCSGSTGHAEVVEVSFDNQLVSLKEILDIFWQAHDPTSLNRQGADTGTQYRSIILYVNSGEKEIAEKSILALEESGKYTDPVVTGLERLEKFYPAEDYHQDYYRRNSSAGYCRVVISPKLKKLGFTG